LEEFSVFIERAKLHLKCGVYEEERELGVQVEVSVKVNSESFVDYQELYNLILKASSSTYTYLEDFMKYLNMLIIDKFNPKEIIITACKLSVPFQHSFERVGVEMRWKR